MYEWETTSCYRHFLFSFYPLTWLWRNFHRKTWINSVCKWVFGWAVGAKVILSTLTLAELFVRFVSHISSDKQTTGPLFEDFVQFLCAWLMLMAVVGVFASNLIKCSQLFAAFRRKHLNNNATSALWKS